MSKSELLEAIAGKIIIADGAIGTELQRAGLEPTACCESWNLDYPERVAAIHRAYIEAGARLITTNSFRANRLALAQFGLESRVEEINQSAVRIARDAAGNRAWVMGSIGPLGGLLKPLGEISIEDAFGVFIEQAHALVASGVDAIIIETMTGAQELKIAARAAREAGAAIVIASMAFDKDHHGYKTMLGVSVEQAIQAMAEANADVVGTNCGANIAMSDYVEIVRRMRFYTDKPIIAEPNAGQPDIVEGKIVYKQTPESMEAVIEELIGAGANVIGGCCGTTPEHIRMFGENLKC
ncbi:MAG TPA: homocysteine S-methyltransferase family protein [Blastocatellia bacterium]|nr:homocysteine S-methyltransferase family protein [Blastocatellia bacterium]